MGFEPTVPCGTSVFKTDAIDHSATSPFGAARAGTVKMPHWGDLESGMLMDDEAGRLGYHAGSCGVDSVAVGALGSG